MHRKRLTVALVLMLLVCAFCMQAFATEAKNPDEKIYLLDAFASTKLDLAQYKGKAIFMNFFTEWCPYCMQ